MKPTILELIESYAKSRYDDGKYGLEQSMATSLIHGNLLKEVNQLLEFHRAQVIQELISASAEPVLYAEMNGPCVVERSGGGLSVSLSVDEARRHPLYTVEDYAALVAKTHKLPTKKPKPFVFKVEDLDSDTNVYRACDADKYITARVAQMQAEIERLKDDLAHRKELFDKGWQKISCPACGMDGAAGFKPANLNVDVQEQSFWSETIMMFDARLKAGPNTVSPDDVMALLSDCQYLAQLGKNIL